MTTLTLKDQPPSTIPATALATADEFTLTILAQQLLAEESISTLLAEPAYHDNIKALEHQRRTALQVLNNFSHRALLADEVGLGKTIEAGIILKEFLKRKLAKKVLILTPAPLKFQWQEELRSKFREDFEIADSPETYRRYDKVISSIDTAKTERHKAVATKIHWDLIIIDEAHKLKNSQTQNYKLVKSLKKDRCLMLTATPLQNNIFELWALLDLLHPGYLGTKQKFTEEYIADDDGLKVKNNAALQEKLGQIMIRNMRKDTGIDFKKRNVHTQLLTYSKEEQAFYDDVIQFVKKRYEEVSKLEKPTGKPEGDIEEASQLSATELKKMADKYKQKGILTFALIMLTRQLTSSLGTGLAALKRYKETVEDEKKARELDYIISKGEALTKDTKLEHLLKTVKGEKDKIIIFTTFIKTQELLEKALVKEGFSVTLFSGSMNPEEKEKAIQEFKETTQVLVCTDAGSEGRNLQFAHILINYDLPWNPMRVEQRIGRVHRIGQEKEVEITNIAVKDTIEGYILNRLYEKIALFTTAIGEMDLILSQLKGKDSIEHNIFDSAITGDDSFGKELEEAKQKAEDIKNFDNDIFGWREKDGS